MGYSANPELVERRRHYLKSLEDGIYNCSWKVSEDLMRTKQYAWEIREALYIASLYPERFPALAKAYKSVSIHVDGPGRIISKPKTMSEIALDQDDELTRPLKQLPEGLTTAAEVMAAWQATQPSNTPLTCKRTKLSEEELKKLYEWTSSKPRRMILVDETAELLTVGPSDPSLKEFAWHPVGEPEPEEEFNL